MTFRTKLDFVFLLMAACASFHVTMAQQHFDSLGDVHSFDDTNDDLSEETVEDITNVTKEIICGVVTKVKWCNYCDGYYKGPMLFLKQ